MLHHRLVLLVAAVGMLAAGCAPPAASQNSNTPPDSPPGNPDPAANDNREPDPGPDPGEPPAGVWTAAFDARQTGVLSGVWGSGPDDVFAVGGTPAQGEIYHFDGAVWQAMRVPAVPLLVWVFGFGPDDVYAVGLGGGALRYDGREWVRLETSTTADLWGIWGPDPGDLWIVGGRVGDGEPLILHYDGTRFEPAQLPAGDRAATALFKVWGSGSRVIAVGENGLILEREGDGPWQVADAGPQADNDFIALWGTSPDRVVAVGGRVSGRVGVRTAQGWTTRQPAGVPALNAVFTIDENHAVVGGVNGFVGLYDLANDRLIAESADASLTVHAAWADDQGRVYAVGGRFSEPFTGLALVRSGSDPGVVPAAPLPAPPECAEDRDCPGGEVCSSGSCIPDTCAGADGDGDGWPGLCDNCPGMANPDQEDGDGDGAGDLCDRCPGFDDNVDADADGVPDGCDACSSGSNTADADGDSVPDACDRCPGSPDAADADADGVPDGCDLCAGPDADDADDDGVPDACDDCAGGDDDADNDGDGVANFCDTCPGHPDADDADADGTPDGCDTCTSTDSADADSDGVPDACDRCPGFDDAIDADGDGVANACDDCPGGDDTQDEDGDAVPDACDECPGSADSADADGDGVPNGCDECPLGDDDADGDGDGVADACDACLGGDDHADGDGDSVPDECDDWPACDNGQDADGDGVPDGCCALESDCPLGQDCAGGLCVVVDADLQIGFGGGIGCPTSTPLTLLSEGDPLPMCEGFQGLSDVWITLQVTGFAPGALLNSTASIKLAEPACPENACPFNMPCLNGLCSPTTEVEQPVQFTDAGSGVNQVVGYYMIILLPVSAMDGREAILSVRISDPADPLHTTSLELPVVLKARRLCFGPTCPTGETCSGNFCVPE